MPGEKILVVDDEPNILDVLATVLRFHGFVVTTATTGAEALKRAGDDRPDLMVLDLILPDLDGFEVCRVLRAQGHRFGIVFLSARDARTDKVSGLTFGGDDYITKPFALDELLARVRAVLRRTGPDQAGGLPGTAGGGSEASAAATTAAVLRAADVELNEDACEVRRGGTLVPLSPTEFRLLRYLMCNPARVLSRTQILDAVWEYDFGGASNVVDTYVGYLRRKLDPLGPPLIHTQRGFGYVFREPPDRTDRTDRTDRADQADRAGRADRADGR